MQTRQEQIQEATINLLIDSNKLSIVEIKHIESFAFGIQMAETLQSTGGNGYKFFAESSRMALVLLKLTPDELERLFIEINLNGGPR
jgi:hypothetical protein